MNKKTKQLLKTVARKQRQLDEEAAFHHALEQVRRSGYPPGRLVATVAAVLRAARRANWAAYGSP